MSYLDKGKILVEKGVEAVVADIQEDQVEKGGLQVLVEHGDGVVRQVQLRHGLKVLGGQEPVSSWPIGRRLAVVDDAVAGQVEFGELLAGGEGVPGNAGDKVLLQLQVGQPHQVQEDCFAQLCDLVL